MLLGGRICLKEVGDLSYDQIKGNIEVWKDEYRCLISY